MGPLRKLCGTFPVAASSTDAPGSLWQVPKHHDDVDSYITKIYVGVNMGM